MNADAREDLVRSLQDRFERHPERHPQWTWRKVLARLEANPAGLAAVAAMEASGGEPDVVGAARRGGPCPYCDCSAESPAGRRSLCYDEEALRARRKDRPGGSAAGVAAAMGVELLDEEQYRRLQDVGSFDLRTSSWIATTPDVRALGGALFGDQRYGRVFVYHNGAESYYAARGFRARRLV